ncbi:MAG TPA: hypothetical protein DEB38_03020 [Acidimicrobiaceae bacterium]|nr:hypothetical protein [Acidimicrobiaceae bacterium]
MLGTSQAGNVAEVTMKVVVREGATTLSHRVIDRLRANADVEMVPLDEGVADVIVDLRVGDHDGLARRHSSATVEGEALMEEVRRVNARRVVMLSSSLVYGPHVNSRIPITEDEVIRPEASFVFARQLSSVEHVLDRWRRGSDDRSVAVLRPTVTMGLGASSSLARALAAGSGRRLGDEEPPAQFLHIDDLAAAVATVVVSEYDGVVNVAPDGWVPGDRVQALLGRRWQIPVPRWVREQLWALQWRFQRGPIPPGLGPYTTTSWVVANDRLKSLGWTSSVTNEQTFVEGTESPWWASITPKRRQELALGGAVVGIVIAASAIVVIGVRAFRRRRQR